MLASLRRGASRYISDAARQSTLSTRRVEPHWVEPHWAEQLMELDARTDSGSTLLELSEKQPVLVVFLRHSGCPYCRQTLAQLAKLNDTFRQQNTKLVIVHHDTPENGAAWIGKYKLDDCEQISDPDGQLYAKFELGKTTWWNLAGPHTWWPGFKATILQLNGVSKPVGDVKQLTGAFLIHKGKIIKAFRQKLSHQSPDYREMVCQL